MKSAKKRIIIEALSTKLSAQYKELVESMRSVQESINGEEKSSAGDKHETSRAMGQLEVERMSTQVKNLEHDLLILKNINPNTSSTKAELGSVVLLENKSIFVSVAAGRFDVEGEEFIAISTNAPIASEILGKQSGEKMKMAGVELQIVNVY